MMCGTCWPSDASLPIGAEYGPAGSRSSRLLRNMGSDMAVLLFDDESTPGPQGQTIGLALRWGQWTGLAECSEGLLREKRAFSFAPPRRHLSFTSFASSSARARTTRRCRGRTDSVAARAASHRPQAPAARCRSVASHGPRHTVIATGSQRTSVFTERAM